MGSESLGRPPHPRTRRWLAAALVLLGHWLMIGGLEWASRRSSLDAGTPVERGTAQRGDLSRSIPSSSTAQVITLRLTPLSEGRPARSARGTPDGRGERLSSSASASSTSSSSSSSASSTLSSSTASTSSIGGNADTGRSPARPPHRPVTSSPPADLAPTDSAADLSDASAAVAAASTPAAATGPSGTDLMHGDATRRAIRQSVREPLLSERSAQSTQTPERADASTRLGQDILKTADGDCLKGEFAGSGMGLLSLPLWAIAEMRGKCRR